MEAGQFLPPERARKDLFLCSVQLVLDIKTRLTMSSGRRGGEGEEARRNHLTFHTLSQEAGGRFPYGEELISCFVASS